MFYFDEPVQFGSHNYSLPQAMRIPDAKADIKMARKEQNLAPMWKKLMNKVDLSSQLHFLTMHIWDVLNVNANRMKLLLRNFR